MGNAGTLVRGKDIKIKRFIVVVYILYLVLNIIFCAGKLRLLKDRAEFDHRAYKRPFLIIARYSHRALSKGHPLY
jgi:hypothetical protein